MGINSVKKFIVVVLLVLLSATPASAALVVKWLEGFESQSRYLACPNSFVDPGGASKLQTSIVASGNVALQVGRPTNGNGGTCQLLASGQNITGTIWFYARLRANSGGFNYSGTISGSLIDFGSLTLAHACTNTTKNCTWSITNPTAGSSFNPTDQVWYPILIKIVTGSGSASVNWWVSTDGQTWTDYGGATSLTISNVDQIMIAYPPMISGGTFGTVEVDDVLLMTGTTPAGPTANTVVNMRTGSTSTPTYNGWTGGDPNGSRTAFVGGSATNISDVWTSPVTGRTDGALNVAWDTTSAYSCQGGSNNGASCTVASQCPGGTCWYGYANSPGGTDTNGQTMKFNAWDSGTPTPTLSTATAYDIWGCRWDAWVTKHNVGSGTTTRTFSLRTRYNSTNTDSSSIASSVTTNTYNTTLNGSLWKTVFDATTGADITAKKDNLNAIEVGGIKTASAGGLAMEIQDVWLQCAWSVAASSGVFQWVQDEE